MRSSIIRIIGFFTVWRVAIILFSVASVYLLPLQKNFLGGGMSNYLSAPYFWSMANFDGEHYLAIARTGYGPLTYFYFPFYPLAVRLGSHLAGQSLMGFVLSGVVISNLAFVVGLIGLDKLIKLDYKDNVSKLALLLILSFPTSLYFGNLYTESVFFALSVWSIYFARKGNWAGAGVFAFVASGTRLVGVVLFLVLAVEWLSQNRGKLKFRPELFFVAIAPFGLFIYMCYLYKVTGDPLEFLHTVEIFGGQRSSKLILLPQVYYRYLFKILPNLTLYWPALFTTTLEFITASIFLILSLVSFKKLRLSYFTFLFGCFIIPTLSGSFSSMPRYVLILFPGFILMSLYLSKAPRFIQFVVISLQIILLFITTSLFVRGFWVS